MAIRPHLTLLIATILITTAGCGQDHRLADMAKDATHRQAEQNQEMMRLNREVAENHHSLIGADGQARQEVLKLQRELIERDEKGRQELNALHRETQTAVNQERSSLDRQHEELENERRQIVGQRHRDPIIAAAITEFGVVLACLAPIVLAVFLLRALHRQEPSDGELAELLVREVASDRSVLFGPGIPEHSCLANDPPSRPSLSSDGDDVGA